MRARGLAAVAACALMAAATLAKTPKNVFLFRLPENVRPETVQVRYFLTGKNDGYAGFRYFELEGSVGIRTDYGKTPALALKAVVFSPSCEPERVVVEDLKASSREYAFQCRPAPVITLKGRFERPPEWKSLRVEVNVEYVAPWANRFLGVEGDYLALEVGDVPADASGQFQVAVPVMGGDAMEGGFSFVLREATSGNVLGVLHPPQPLSSPHGLRTAAEYPVPVEFGLTRNR